MFNSCSPTTRSMSDASASYEGSTTYDVFLSFRGSDTRNGFTAHLYDALCNKDIQAFMDANKIVKGEDISPALASAMDRSMFCIVVLSKNYAYSTWCLDELVQILKCKNAKKQAVLPVFYNVNPSDIRYQKGRFGKALAKHEKKFKEEMERVQIWRQALTEVANISGWDARNRHEPTVIKEIVQHILDGLGNAASSSKEVAAEDSQPPMEKEVSTTPDMEERREIPLVSKRKINRVVDETTHPHKQSRHAEEITTPYSHICASPTIFINSPALWAADSPNPEFPDNWYNFF